LASDRKGGGSKAVSVAETDQIRLWSEHGRFGRNGLKFQTGADRLKKPIGYRRSALGKTLKEKSVARQKEKERAS